MDITSQGKWDEEQVPAEEIEADDGTKRIYHGPSSPGYHGVPSAAEHAQPISFICTDIFPGREISAYVKFDHAIKSSTLSKQISKSEGPTIWTQILLPEEILILTLRVCKRRL